MPHDTHFDVIIIGSGAGGGTLLHRLASSGKRILLLERGDWMPREPENWDSKAVWIDKRYANSGKWTDAATGKKFTPKQHYYVGGNTKVYGAILFRFRERDFGEITHVDGVSPAWPIDYHDLAPWYDRAESLYQVHCASCHLAHLGGRNEAPQLAGGNFMKTWTRRTTRDLFVYMQATMPPSNRGGLGEDAYVNLTAFILEANGAVAGTQPMQAATRVAIGTVANGQMTPELRTKLNAAATSNQAGLFMIVPTGNTELHENMELACHP